MELAVAIITLLATVLTAWAKMSDKRKLREPERLIEEEDREIERILKGSRLERSAHLGWLLDKAERSNDNRR